MAVKVHFLVTAFVLITTGLFAQNTPDTLHYLHNNTVSGTQWAFTVAHITDVHLGETSTGGDYGTTGWNDTIDASTTCPATDALRNTVQWINSVASTEKIELLIVSGDIADRGEKSGFIMARRILDSLIIPYIITNGNHDMWPRVSGNEAPLPFGDSVFAEVFASHFTANAAQFSGWDDGTRLNSVYNPLNGMFSLFQNFAFSKGSYRFIVNDFGTRNPKPVGVGTMTDAALFNFAGGTYQWLAAAMAQANPGIDGGTILVQHFPMDNELLSATYSFSSSEYDSLIDIIEPYASQFGLCIAGHRHRNKTYTIKRSTFSPVLGMGIETDACNKYTGGMVRLIKFWDYPTAAMSKQNSKTSIKLYPNPASKMVTIEIDDLIQTDGAYMQIYSAQGILTQEKRLTGQHKIAVNLMGMAPGLYIVKIVQQDEAVFLKLIIER